MLTNIPCVSWQAMHEMETIPLGDLVKGFQKPTLNVDTEHQVEAVIVNGVEYQRPEEGVSSITRSVCADLIRREQLGAVKYGKALEPHDGRRTLQDVLEELLDAAVYVKKCIIEQEWQPIEKHPKDCQKLVLATDGKCVFTMGWVIDISDDDYSFWQRTDGNDASKATHWRPLPTPPKE